MNKSGFSNICYSVVMNDETLFPKTDLRGSCERECSKAVLQGGAPRLRRPSRSQMVMETLCLDDLLGDNHSARLVWMAIQRLDMTRFYERIAARGCDPGRPATDPQLLVALWLYASIDNVGSARRLAVLCEEHNAYRWLCGGISVNHHTLSDFRVAHESALDDLLTEMITVLIAKGVVQVDRISQDGVRIRASAGRSSFRRERTLQKLRRQVSRHVQRLKQPCEDEADPRSSRQRAAQERAARERLWRLDQALALLPELEAVKQNPTGKPSKHRPVRISTTDPQVRRMKLGDGSVQPAYNVQFATDTKSRVVVGVDVITAGDDYDQSRPMREQVEHRSGGKVTEHLYDGGYVKKAEIEKAETEGVAIYAPLPLTKEGQPCIRGRGDPPGVASWRQRMQTPQAKEIYKLRASTSETVNAETKTYRGLSAFNVRGVRKVRCVALWSALAYNIVHVGASLIA